MSLICVTLVVFISSNFWIRNMQKKNRFFKTSKVPYTTPLRKISDNSINFSQFQDTFTQKHHKYRQILRYL